MKKSAVGFPGVLSLKASNKYETAVTIITINSVISDERSEAQRNSRLPRTGH
jgi:hypothetical protein